MKRPNLLILGLIALLLFMTTYLNSSISKLSGHLSDSVCHDCHLAKTSVNSDNASMLINSQEVLCKGCHKTSLNQSHPSGIRPSFVISKESPLDWKGDLTCSSCHNIHGTAPGLMRSQLRGKAYCLSCHKEDFFLKMKDRGDSLIRSGHLGSIVSTHGLDLDAYSLECLECHLKTDSAPVVNLGEQGIVRHTSGSVNHPIGKDYKKAEAYGGYHPASSLPQQIQLPDGKVSCISCHEGYSGNHGSLVLGNTGSTLCFKCHDI